VLFRSAKATTQLTERAIGDAGHWRQDQIVRQLVGPDAHERFAVSSE